MSKFQLPSSVILKNTGYSGSPLSGAPWALAGTGFSVASFMFAKLLGQYAQFSVFEINIYRSLFTLFSIVVFASFKHYSLKTSCLKVHGIRSIFGWLGMILQTFAIISTAPLPIVQVLSSTSPIFFILILAIVYRHSISIVIWISLAFAFLGTNILLHTQSVEKSGSVIPLFIALAAGLFTSITFLNLKELEQRKEYVWKIVFYYSAFSLIYSGICLAFLKLPFREIYNLKILLWILGLCISFCISQLCMARSFMQGDPSITALFNYSQVLYSTLFSIFIFDQTIDGQSVIGISIVIMSGLVINFIKLFNLERKLK